jgi:hypothetical protein
MNLREWFNNGMNYDEYTANMNVNQQEVAQVYQNLEFSSEDEQFFTKWKGAGWSTIVLTADWCGDAALNVPIMKRVTELAGIDMRLLIRDDNLELMDQYLTNGKSRSIPIFIFIDSAGKEQLVWGPRSPEVQKYVTSLRAALPEADAPDFEEKQKAMYKTFKKTITTDPAIWRTVINSIKERFDGTK